MVAINDPCVSTEEMVRMIKYDSNYGQFPGEVEVGNTPSLLSITARCPECGGQAGGGRQGGDGAARAPPRLHPLGQAQGAARGGLLEPRLLPGDILLLQLPHLSNANNSPQEALDQVTATGSGTVEHVVICSPERPVSGKRTSVDVHSGVVRGARHYV